MTKAAPKKASSVVASKKKKPAAGAVVKSKRELGTKVPKREPGKRKPSEFDIKDPSLKTIGKAGGNPSVARNTPFAMRKTGDRFLRRVIANAGTHMRNAKRKTLMKSDMVNAMQSMDETKIIS
jgi:histone H3/H4